MMKRMTALAAGLVCWAMGGAAHAKVESATLGLLVHSVPVSDIKNSDKESGVDLQAQVNFTAPGFFKYALSPQPYLIATLNTNGDTSYGGFGFQWDFGFADKWHFNPAVGYVIHNGDTNEPASLGKGTPAYQAYLDEHLLLGSPDLFRLALAVSREIGPHTEAEFSFEHLSHGYIIGDGRNQGLDNAGLRLIYKY
jgi:lipid A 3-O-deacylase